MGRMTLRQVALRAGVGVATASRALGGAPDVAADTAERVKRAAQELGYTPNRSARELRAGRTDPLVAVLVDPESIFGVDRDTHKFWFVSSFELFDDLAQDHIGVVQISAQAPELLSKIEPDAIFVMSLSESSELGEHLPAGVPVVSLSGAVVANQSAASVVEYNWEEMTAQALDLVHERGARQPVLLVRPGEHVHITRSKHAYESWCRAHDTEIQVLGERGGNRELSEDIARLCQAGSDAIVSMRGESRSALEGIAMAGLACPADVLLVAAGEGTGELLLHPTVSVIQADPVVAGQAFAEVLRRVLAGDVPGRVELAHELVERESSQR